MPAEWPAAHRPVVLGCIAGRGDVPARKEMCFGGTWVGGGAQRRPGVGAITRPIGELRVAITSPPWRRIPSGR